MDLRQLQTLVAVADHRTFSAAAKALFTVQSNVSAHIARLERELGVVLVDRGRGTLTDEGRVVVARARRVQAELDAVRADLASLGHEVAGDVRLGIVPTTARWLLPRLLDSLEARHPRIRLVTVAATSRSLLPQLHGGGVDAAVLALPVDDPEVAVHPLFREDLVLVTPADHPLAGRARVGMADLTDVPLLLEAPGTSLRNEVDAAAARAGVRLRARAEVDGVRLLAALALDGLGAAVVPVTALPTDQARVRVLAVTDLAPREIGLVRRRAALLTTATHAVLDQLTRVLATGAPVPGVRLLTAAPAGDT